MIACGKKINSPSPGRVSVDQVHKTYESHLFGITIERKFHLLPLTGEIKNKSTLWSGDYWPFNKGSINKRWNTDNKEGFDLTSPTKEEIFLLDQNQIAKLSPSEKFDLYNDDYDYTLRREVEILANINAPDWEGMCQGWAIATVNYSEPNAIEVTNSEGIRIPFGSSDIKALLGYYYSFAILADTEQIGKRCESDTSSGPECNEDLDAGTFHLALTNKLGVFGDSFIVDVARGNQVWNHPVYSYHSQITVQRRNAIDIKTRVVFIDEVDTNTWETILGTNHQSFTKRQYEYRLELTNEGNIIGGKWLSEERPDFIWNAQKVTDFEGKFSKLIHLIN